MGPESARVLGKPYRLAGETRQALGVQGTGEAAEAAALEQARVQSRPHYRQAMTQPTHSQFLMSWIADPIAERGRVRGY